MSITTFGLAAALGFLTAGYLLWQNAREENLSPEEVFDIFIASSIWAFIAARAAAVALQFDRFGWNPLRWLAIFHLPGLNSLAALAVGVLMITIGISRRGWNTWLGLDVFTPAILVWQAALVITFNRQLSLFWAAWALVLVYVNRHYRLWEWYRGRKSDAKPGLVTSLWLVGLGLGFFLLALLKISMIFLSLVGAGLIAVGLVSGYRRSGRRIASDTAALKKYLVGKFKPFRRPQRKRKLPRP